MNPTLGETAQVMVELKIENELAFITFDTKEKKVNLLTLEAARELGGLIGRVSREKGLKALVIQSGKSRTFIAGADIREIEGIQDRAQAEAMSRAGQGIINAIEDLEIPSIVLINGACLGGGLELALAATYRFASHGDWVQIGLPEVRLGIIPGFGGTYRLPAVVGLERGLEMIVQGRTVDGPAAYRMGLVDGLASERLLFETAFEYLAKEGFRKRRIAGARWSLRSRLLEGTAVGRRVLRAALTRKVLETTRGNYPAPLKAVEVVVRNYRAPREEALRLEAREFANLAATGEYKKLIRVFYLTERYKKERWTQSAAPLPRHAARGSGEPRSGLAAAPLPRHAARGSGEPRSGLAAALPVRKCGVVGAGVMGGSIAQLVSLNGVSVRLKDLNHEALLLGLRAASALYRDLVKKRKLSQTQAEARMGLILPSLDYSGYKRADLVIEAVVENIEIKKSVFQELEGRVSPETILASNTSSLSITEIARGLKNPSRVVGMHFFNPVHRMPLVEVIRARETSEEVLESVIAFSRRLKKTALVVKDAPGFLVNRILLPFLNEAGYLLEEGVSLEKIDEALLAFGMPMGAFILMDEIGLDVGTKVSEILHESFGDRMKVPSAFGRIVQRKWMGKKSGKGFYLHSAAKNGKKPPVPNAGLAAILPAVRRHVSAEGIVSRTLSVMVNEAALCLEEGIVREPADVDIGMLMGTGFPAFRGGLLGYADEIGAEKIVKDLERFQKEVDLLRFKPSRFLMDMAKRRGKFYPD